MRRPLAYARGTVPATQCTCFDLWKTFNNLVFRVVNTALTKYSSILIHRRGRRGTQRESGLHSPLRPSAPSAVEPKIDNFVNVVVNSPETKFFSVLTEKA